MQKIYSLLFLALLLFISHPFVSKANQPETEPLVFMWWNLENLFDTLDDPSTNDSDFTPSGKLHWTEKKLKTETAAHRVCHFSNRKASRLQKVP